MPRARITIAPRRSVALFALLAVAMVITSYAVILALAAACVYLPYLLLTNINSLHFQVLALFLGGIAAAGAMLWSLVPRREKFEAPGLLIERSEHPRLFAEIDDIAASLDEPVPHEVYLIGQVNAFVADKGGWLGFGSQRILAVGLPLLSLLTVAEIRGILAHEFAHYYSGDTRMGPWVYRAQGSMIRSFQNIGSLREVGRIAILQVLYQLVTVVLKWNFLFFLRVIQFVSRRKEFRADELACLVAGKEPMISGMKKIHEGGMAWTAYWNTEVAPVLQRGFIPPLGDGLVRFLAAPQIAEQVAHGMEKEMAEGKASPYDTHPPLRERIAAMQALATDAVELRETSALNLLNDAEHEELRMLLSLNPKLPNGDLQRVSWDEVGRVVTIPAWTSAVKENAALLEGITAEGVPEKLKDLSAMGARMRDPKGMLLAPDQRKQRAGGLLAGALVLTLIGKGWQLEAQPGNFYLHRGNQRLDPFAMFGELAEGKITVEAWRERCREWGIEGASLGGGEGEPQAEM
jgi:heat shock protein HtpX